MRYSSLVRLKNQYDSLPDGEKRVADYILGHPADIPLLSVGRLAQASHCAASCIVRLCQRIGFTGYAELKRNLLTYPADESVQQIGVVPHVTPTDDVETIFNKVFRSGQDALRDTLSALDWPNVRKLTEVLAGAKRIFFFGVGTSATLAQDAYYRFMRIGLPASAAVDDHIMLMEVSQMGVGDVAVGISHCGATVDTVETLRLAKEKGAVTVAITSFADSPINRYADYSLVAFSDEIRYPIEAVSARMAHIAILDALCVAVSLQSYPETATHVAEMHRLFSTKRCK